MGIEQQQQFEVEPSQVMQEVDMEELSEMLAGRAPVPAAEPAPDGEQPAPGEAPQAAPASGGEPAAPATGEPAAPAGEAPPPAAEGLAPAKRDFKNVNQLFAHGRRVAEQNEQERARLAQHEAQLAQREAQMQQEHARKLADVAKLEQMLESGDPAIIRVLAEKRGVRESDMLEQIQRAIVEGRGPAPKGSAPEVDALSKKLDAVLERLQAGEQQQRQYVELSRAQEAHKAHREAAVQQLEKWSADYAEHYPHFAELTPAAQKQAFDEFVGLLQERNMLHATSPDEVLSALDTNEKSVRGRYRTATIQPAGVQAALGAGSTQAAPTSGQSPTQRVAGSPAQSAQKASAVQPRTVPTNHDAANGGGARREKTQKENLADVDVLFRTGKLPDS